MNRFTTVIDDEHCEVVQQYINTASRITKYSHSNWSLLLIDRQDKTVYLGAYAFANMSFLQHTNYIPLYVPFNLNGLRFRVLDGRAHSRERYGMLLVEYLKAQKEIM